MTKKEQRTADKVLSQWGLTSLYETDVLRQTFVFSISSTNPAAFLNPCHRVIQSTGILGGYMWGNTTKTAIIGWVETKTHSGFI